MLNIRDLKLPQGVFSDYSTPESAEPDTLQGLSKVNVFVGANNSGKSRLLRKLAALENIRFRPERSLKWTMDLKNELQKETEHLFSQAISEAGGFRQGVRELKAVDFITENADPLEKYKSILQSMKTTKGHLNLSQNQNGHVYGQDVIVSRLNTIGSAYLERLQSASVGIPDSFDYARYYIPPFRSLRFFGQPDDFFAKTAANSYFSEGNCPTIFTGLNMRSQVEELLLGDQLQRKALHEFETYLSDSFFGGAEVLLHPRKGKDVLYVKIGHDDEMPIYSLGDGIQMSIILTFPLFRFSEENKLIFIEEPELYLHPGMQRMLMDQFLKAKNTQIFLATHSNHFLDMTLDSTDISIFALSKSYDSSSGVPKARFEINQSNFGDSRPLVLLGTRNSSVFLTNCTVWVEGITDRRYLRKFLDLYLQSLDSQSKGVFAPKEDLHFSFVEYSGGNITHWSILDDIPDAINVERLCGRLFLVTDRDSESGKKGDRIKRLGEKLGEQYYCLKCREFENLLPEKSIRAVLRHYEEDENTLNPFTSHAYRNSYLGKFIEEMIIPTGKRKRKGSYAEESGTVSQKMLFCELAVTALETFSDLPGEAQQLTKLIYSFIASRNR